MLGTHVPGEDSTIVGCAIHSAVAARDQTPLDRITSAVMVHTTMVSMKGSRPATTPSVTGSEVLTAECAIGAEPSPASEENSARFMPKMKVVPKAAPVNAPTPSAGEKAETKIRWNIAGSCSALATRTASPLIT